MCWIFLFPTSTEDVLRRALEAQDAEESWTDEERRYAKKLTVSGTMESGSRACANMTASS
jgi:hypothetical protein